MAQEHGSFLYVDMQFSLIWDQIQLKYVAHCNSHTTSDLKPFTEGAFFQKETYECRAYV